MSVKVRYSDELYHYGIKGQKWGVRRYQNEDGTLTAEGKKRYKDFKKEIKRENRRAKDLTDLAAFYGGYSQRGHELVEKKVKSYNKNPSRKNELMLEAAKTIAQAGDMKVSEYDSLMKDHYNSLLEKYGSDHVKPIEYDRSGVVKQSMSRKLPKYLSEYARGGALGGAIYGALDAYEYIVEGNIPSEQRTKRGGRLLAYADAGEYFNALKTLDKAKQLREVGETEKADKYEQQANKTIKRISKMKR